MKKLFILITFLGFTLQSNVNAKQYFASLEYEVEYDYEITYQPGISFDGTSIGLGTASASIKIVAIVYSCDFALFSSCKLPTDPIVFRKP